MSGSYTPVGPFTDGGAPGVSAEFLNPLETFLTSINSAAYDPLISANAGIETVVGLITGAGLASLASKMTGVSGSASGSMTVYETFAGSFKVVLVIFSNFKNTGGAVSVTLTTAFNGPAFFLNGGGPTVNLMNSGSPLSEQIITALSTSGGTTTPHTGFASGCLGWTTSPFTAIQEPGGDSSTSTGIVVIIGV